MEERPGKTGGVKSVWFRPDALELVDRAASVFGVSRSAVLNGIIEDKREELETAIALKINSSPRPEAGGGKE